MNYLRKNKISIIVITPTKNEEWIIDAFLKVTLMFADHIIIADQQSSDRTVEICQGYDRVTVIKNDGEAYDEAYRQVLLLSTARNMFPGEKVIFALDADEVLSANSINSAEWEIITSSAPGTVFYFEKPELYMQTGKTIRYHDRFYPLAFVDDDVQVHHPSLVHSIRIPISANIIKRHIPDIKFLHVAYLRPAVQRAKYRFYAVQENLLKTSPWFRRRRRYRNGNQLLYWEPLEDTPGAWLVYPDACQVRLSDITDQPISWYDHAVMNIFRKYGTIRFWLDDIWDQDWPRLMKSSGAGSCGPLPPAFLLRLLTLTNRFNK